MRYLCPVYAVRLLCTERMCVQTRGVKGSGFSGKNPLKGRQAPGHVGSSDTMIQKYQKKASSGPISNERHSSSSAVFNVVM